MSSLVPAMSEDRISVVIRSHRHRTVLAGIRDGWRWPRTAAVETQASSIMTPGPSDGGEHSGHSSHVPSVVVLMFQGITSPGTAGPSVQGAAVSAGRAEPT